MRAQTGRRGWSVHSRPVRVFLAGATGVIGIRLVPRLVAAGHEVVGMTRTQSNADLLRRSGAVPAVCDVFDAETLDLVVARAQPDLVMHQLTDLPDDIGRFEEFAAGHNRIRTVGTRNLIAAARAAGVPALMAQSVAWRLAGEGGAAVDELERMVLEYPGVVIRYGQFHGPGTYHPAGPPAPPSIHVDDAATRTVDLLSAKPGIVTVTAQ